MAFRTPDHVNKYLSDLTDFIRPYEAAGNEILLTMDANATLDSPSMLAFMDALNLHDLMEEFLPTTQPPTFQRGRHKIDHILGTIGVLLSVINAYVLPIGWGPNSDHAICAIDISLEILTGIPASSLHDPTHPSSRNLWSTDIKASEKYNELVQRRFTADNIANRMTKLIKRCNRTEICSDNDIKILNAIDRNITEIMLWAERKCKNAKGHAWSPLLANAGRTVIAAKWHLSDVRNGRYQLPPNIPRADAIKNAKAKIKEAYALLRQVQDNAKQIRDSFLEDRAEHLADTQNITKEAALRKLIAAERQSSIFKRLGFYLKGDEHVKMNRILVPDDPDDMENTSWSAVVEAQALFEVLTKASQDHFHQAANTPFVSGPIADMIGPFDENAYCEEILNGTFDLSKIEERIEVKDLVRGMRFPDPSNPTPPLTPLYPRMDSLLQSPTPENAHPHHLPDATMDTTEHSFAMSRSLAL